jgi:UDP-glucose 4-epimerase
MKTVITGGAGFLGSHLVDYLLDRGDTITVLDNLSTGSLDNLAQAEQNENFTFVRGSVLDRRLVDDVMLSAHRVFHLAAAVGVRRIIEHPLQSLKVNLHGTENVLRSALMMNATMVLASTSEIYGLNSADALTEDSNCILGAPQTSRWSYASAKILDEAFAYAYHREHHLRVSIGRLFNTVGPRQKGRYGMVLPTLVGQALRNEPLTVFGDGQQTRCFGHVRDTIPALVRLSEVPEAVGQAFNLGRSEEISIMDLARKIIELTDSTSEIVLVPYEEAYGEGYADMRRRVPDNSKARRVLGFNPTTTLDEMILSIAHGLRDKTYASA